MGRLPHVDWHSPAQYRTVGRHDAVLIGRSLTMTQPNETILNELMGHVLGDLGGAVSVLLVRIGDALGLYRALREIGLAKVDELAEQTGCTPRYVRDWLVAQTASGYVRHERGQFSLTPEQAYIFAEARQPGQSDRRVRYCSCDGGKPAEIAIGLQVRRGVAWGEQAGCMSCAVARLFRPGYVNALVQDWLPALDGVLEKLKTGSHVADVGCGHGLSTILMAQVFPASRFIGYDFHASIAAATAHTRAHQLSNVLFEIGRARDFGGRDFDLIAGFDCLHDMGDPQATAAHFRKALKTDGTWMVMSPSLAIRWTTI